MLRKTALLSLTMLAVTAPAWAAKTKEDPRQNLVISGEVKSIEKDPSDAHSVSYTVHLTLHFFNKGETAVIFFKPGIRHKTNAFWPGGKSLALTDVHAERGNYIWDWQMWPGLSTGPSYDLAASALDKKAPPADEMLVLKPQEKWDWDTEFNLYFYAQTTHSGYSSHDLGWETVSRIKTPLWLRLSYMLWDPNLERADAGLKGRLRKRWQKLGYLMTDLDLTTKPVPIKLYELEQLTGQPTAAPEQK